MRTAQIITGAVLLLASANTQAATAQLECVSYSKAYDLAISVSDAQAVIQILRADEQRNSFSLAKGDTITLARAEEHHRDWARFEGLTKRNQHLTFSGKKADLASAHVLTTNLAVSADWTDTTEVMLQIDCQNIR